MAQKVTKDMNIMDILQIDEGLAPIFMEAGMGCLGCAAAHFENAYYRNDIGARALAAGRN